MQPFAFIGSTEHAQDELSGYCDVRRMYGRLRRPSVNFFACVQSREHSFDWMYMKLCQNVNLHEI